MVDWTQQINCLIAPAVVRSDATEDVVIGSDVLDQAGRIAQHFSDTRKAMIFADSDGYAAAGEPVRAALAGAGFTVESLILPADPLPKASVEEAEAFRQALAQDPDLFPVSVGSGVINDLVKFAAYSTNRRYLTVATAASMDGYTSAGAPLAEGGFKVTIPTRAPIAMLADLDVIASAPAKMNGWGYGDLAGKVPAGGDWIIADAMGAEPLDQAAWPLVQDNLGGWLSGPAGIASGDRDAVARLFVGLTAVGFAMEFHGSSRPASGADHQIAHMWEMEGLTHQDRKVSHGAAVAVGAVVALTLFDWLLQQEFASLDTGQVLAAAPDLDARLVRLKDAISDPRVAAKAEVELRAKHADASLLPERLEALKTGWPTLRKRLTTHLMRADDMASMLTEAGAPAHIHQIGVSPEHLTRTLWAASFIRRRYTIFDLLHETGLTEQAFAAILPVLTQNAMRAAE